jgi:hypothetical protein
VLCDEVEGGLPDEAVREILAVLGGTKGRLTRKVRCGDPLVVVSVVDPIFWTKKTTCLR